MTWLVPLPIVLPLVGAALSILAGRSRAAQRVIGITILAALASSVAGALASRALQSKPPRERREPTRFVATKRD